MHQMRPLPLARADVGLRQQVRSQTVGERRLIDPDRDLLSPDEVATEMGLANADVLAVYVARYEDFPSPWIRKGRYIRLYLRSDIEAFLAAHPRMGRKRDRDAGADPS